VEPSAMWSPEK